MKSPWLDSLSEDWVSEPEPSKSSVSSLLSVPSNPRGPTSQTKTSRIPKYNPKKPVWAAQDRSDSSPSQKGLERINSPIFRHTIDASSKPRPLSTKRDNILPLCIASPSTGSVQNLTVQHKPHILSPNKGAHETHDWKRKLIDGELKYGEQRDLFSPVGLESIFKPPVSFPTSPNKSPLRNTEESTLTLTSSPPPYSQLQRHQGVGRDQEEQVDETEPQKSKQGMKYNLNWFGASHSSVNDTIISSGVLPVLERKHFLRDESTSTSHAEKCENPPSGARRIVSCQSDLRNEELSQIQVAKQSTVDGRTDYAAVGLSPDKCQRSIVNLHEIPVQAIEEGVKVLDSIAKPTDSPESMAYNSQSVSRPIIDHFQEDSSQPELPELAIPSLDESALIQEDSLQASTPKKLPNTTDSKLACSSVRDESEQILPDLPKTPCKSSAMEKDKEMKSAPRSPLKIFEAHDTFTNEKLIRRLGQLEYELEEPYENDQTAGFVHGFTQHKAKLSPQEQPYSTGKIPLKISNDLSNFGVGDLDAFQFSNGPSFNSDNTDPCQDTNENPVRPVFNQNVPLASKSYPYRLAIKDNAVLHSRGNPSSAPTTSQEFNGYEKKRRSFNFSSPLQEDNTVSQIREHLHTPRRRNGDLEGKRLSKTPLRETNPKRRRTLQMRGFDLDSKQNTATRSLPSLKLDLQIQPLSDRKQKDLRLDNDQRPANSKFKPSRQISPARMTKSNCRCNSETGQNLLQEINSSVFDNENTNHRQEITGNRAGFDLDTLPRVSTSILGTSQPMCNESRKGSVTTQDFLDKAQKIMAVIRSETRLQSGLTSVEESELENDQRGLASNATPGDQYDDSFQESTQEPFSRPPSRDGAAPLPRIPNSQCDPAILDHLRKYQENPDPQAAPASSLETVEFVKDFSEAAKKIDRLTEEKVSTVFVRRSTAVGTIESDPPNIRISKNPELEKHKDSVFSMHTRTTDNIAVDYPSQASNPPSSESTVHSIPTGSSRGSDSRRVIAPQSVSHLIPEQLAGMIFDNEQKIWIKKASSGMKSDSEFLPSEGTEDDPFGDIPDLTVDETLEMQRIKATAAAAERRDEIQIPQDRYGHDGNNATPKSAKEKDNSSQAHTPRYTEKREGGTEEPKKDVSVYNPRPYQIRTPKRRNITISFSSPIASFIDTQECQGKVNICYDEENDVDFSEDNLDQIGSNGNIIVKKERRPRSSAATKLMSSRGSIPRRLSVGGLKFSARPVSRIEERDEDNCGSDDDARKLDSVSIVVAGGTSPNRISSVVLATPRLSHEIGTLTLTPLSDFTIHQADESLGLDVSYVAHQTVYRPENSKRTLSLSIKKLVEKITEVEPYEPFWEHIKEINLKDKRLTSVHKLDEFCHKLESLDVSHNQLCHLDGVPRTVRSLHIIDNCVTNMTAWGHLVNLQYVDVSNNQLESLSSLKSLAHMRSLRADKNRIVSLEGIDQLDALLDLRLRDNQISSIDFHNTKLQLLTDLDLRGNRVSKFENFQQLKNLSKLDLVDNELTEFTVNIPEPLGSIKYLRLSGNNLKSIDVSHYPNLRLLYLDRNMLGKVRGLLKTKYLDSFSMREQRNSTLDSSFLSESFEVRKLFLSGNLLTKFEPQSDFLNLQYLELANCGLESLPKDFGSMIANVRVLNLNFNALTNIRSLFGMLRLKKLHLAGNRLLGLECIAKLLSYFTSLALVDLRSNPLTVGFYSPNLVSRAIPHDSIDIDETEVQEPYTMAKSNKTKDILYKSCLDMRTQMKRRIYEMYIIGSALRLKLLDGLPVDKSILITEDEVYHSMVEAGFITGPCPARNHSEVKERKGKLQDDYFQGSDDKESWPAEDSFA